MRELILHLGMNKTGSTTIQRAMRDMDLPGIAYPDLGGSDHIHALDHAYMTDLPRHFGSFSPALRRSLREEARARIVSAYRADARSVLLSSEDLSIFGNPGDIAALLADARPHFDRIRALAYLREPHGYMTSSVQQAAKRRDVPDAPFAGMYPRYGPRFRPWVDALGAADISLVAFDPAAFENGDVLSDFLHRLDRPGVARPSTPPSNRSLSAEAVAVLLVRHRHPGEAPVSDVAQTALIEALAGFGETRLAFCPDMLAGIVTPCAKDIRWAEARMGRPFPPPPAPTGPIWPGIPELRAHGETLLGPLRDWQRRVAPRARPAADTVPAILDAAARALTPRRGPLSLVRRALGR